MTRSPGNTMNHRLFPSARMFRMLSRCMMAAWLTVLALPSAHILCAQEALPTEPASLPAASDSQGSTAPRTTPETRAKLVDFARDIAPILASRCSSCHEGDGAKNGFLVGDRDSVLGFVEAGSTHDSSLWTDYLMAEPVRLDKRSLVMPPDGPLPRGELALLKLWIDEGADWPEGVHVGSKVVKDVEVGERTTPQRVFRAIGYFHPAVVHFPIALISVAAVSVALSYLFGSGFARFGYYCLVIGALFAVLSAVMGWSFAETRGFTSWTQMLASQSTEEEGNQFFHRWLGTTTAFLGLIVCLLGWRARKPDGTRPGHAWRVGTLLLAILVAIVGHQGGELVYGDIFGKALEQLSK